MTHSYLKLSRFVIPLLLCAGSALAQTAAPSTPTGSSSGKKELIARVLKLQSAGIEVLARDLAQDPAAQLLNQASLALQTQVPAESREAVAKEIRNDAKKYTDEAVPLVRDRAIKLAPSTVGKVLEDKFTEDELKQVVALLESPVYAKYLQLNGEMQRSLLEKLVAETRPSIEPKIKALEASMGKRLNQASGASKPAAPAK